MLFRKEKYKILMNADDSIIVIRLIHKNNQVSMLKSCIIDNNIILGDITCYKNNRGYGSVLLSKLIEYARENNYQSIEGWLSNVDKGHKDRLIHFYRKFGFEITLVNKKIKMADIKLNIIK